MPTSVTEGIRITVEATYLEDRSSPEEGSFAFAYQVTIANEGHGRVQLMRRHWIITDGNGEVREVEGPGVVGEQPVLNDGEAHHYTSGAVLTTPVGTMEGSYEMQEPDGRVFRASIPRFALRKPGVLQ
jgi:ApaG protein